MQSNKLRLAIRATAAATVFGMAGQAGAVSFETGGWDSSIYGYARLNMSYDIDENVSTSTRSFDFSQINVGSAEDDEVTGHFGADAYQSRIGFTTTSEEGVTFKIEGDFRGSGGGVVRLRHAYGSYNGILAGQTWSNFTSFVGNTSTLNFDSLPGLAGYQSRTAQLRYTTGPLSVSIEDPKNSIANAIYTTKAGDPVTNAAGDPVGVDANKDGILSASEQFMSGKETASAAKDSMPAITARLEDSSGNLSYSAAVLAHQLAYDTGAADDSAFGFATFVAGKVALTDMVSVQGTLSYTDGANSYLYLSGAPSGYVSKQNGDLETVSGYGGSLGAGFNLGSGRSFNIGYGMTEVDLDDAVTDGAVKSSATQTISAVMANYQWTPVKNVMMGVEYAYGMRETQAGDDGDANHLLFAAQYNF